MNRVSLRIAMLVLVASVTGLAVDASAQARVRRLADNATSSTQQPSTVEEPTEAEGSDDLSATSRAVPSTSGDSGSSDTTDGTQHQPVPNDDNCESCGAGSDGNQ